MISEIRAANNLDADDLKGVFTATFSLNLSGSNANSDYQLGASNDGGTVIEWGTLTNIGNATLPVTAVTLIDLEGSVTFWARGTNATLNTASVILTRLGAPL